MPRPLIFLIFVALGIAVLVLIVWAVTFITPNDGSNVHEEPLSKDPGQPLFLTPYLEKGDIETARSLSKVGKLPHSSYVPQIPSFSGFFTVDKKHDSNMFFWFIPAQNKDRKAPVILWLAGGPGTSDLFGSFVLNGPYSVTKNLTLEVHPHTWTKEFHVLFVDNPVGTGFSFSNPEGYCENEDQVAKHMYELLQQFFKVFYEYATNDFYITGDSYAGNYVPAIACKIHADGPPAPVTFKGIAVSSGLYEPEMQLNYSEFLYQLGIVDRKQAAVIRKSYDELVKNIRNGNLKQAIMSLDDCFHYYSRGVNTSHLYRFGGYKYFENLLQIEEPEDRFYFTRYIELPAFRKALHVGNLSFESPPEMMNALFPSSMLSNRHQLTTIMNNYKVMLFYGQMDMYSPYPPSYEFIASLEWKLSDEFRECDRRVWRLEGKDEVVGYIHNVGDFYSALVRSAGHRPTYEQPEPILDLITRFIKERL